MILLLAEKVSRFVIRIRNISKAIFLQTSAKFSVTELRNMKKNKKCFCGLFNFWEKKNCVLRCTDCSRWRPYYFVQKCVQRRNSSSRILVLNDKAHSVRCGLICSSNDYSVPLLCKIFITNFVVQ